VWEHRRELEALSDGSTRVTDTLRAEPRRVLPGPVVRMVVTVLFRHRHNRLVRKFSA
jgi:ligand-binding SRPBCC domain-containing protein